MNAALQRRPVIDVAGAAAAFTRYFVGGNRGQVLWCQNGWLFRPMIANVELAAS